MLMFIRDSRRSYRTYSYAELILITDLGAFRTPVGVTELMLMLRSLNLFGGTRRYHRDYETYNGILEHVLVLRNLYWSYGTYTGLTELIFVYRTYSYLTDLILVSRNLYFSYGTYTGLTELIFVYRTYSYLTEIILVLRIREYSYVLQNLYLFTDTRVPVGTTGLILTLSIREYP